MAPSMTSTYTTTLTKRKNQNYTENDVKMHCTADDCWIISRGYVYDVTNFLIQHPGGADLILSHAGEDVTKVMKDQNLHFHSNGAYNILEDYKIGKVKYQNGGICETRKDIEDEFSMNGYKEELLDWNQGLVKQVYKLGPDYVKWVHSPVNRNLRLFDSNFVEFFSKTPWYVVPIVWIPVVMVLAHLSIVDINSSLHTYSKINQESILNLSTFVMFAIMFILGIPLWTLVEYILHRYIFHLEPKGDSPVWITLHFFIHGQHHKVPFDSSRLVFPPVAASGFAFPLYVLFTRLIPGGCGCALFSGGLLGYVIYDMIHYYMHHGCPERGSYLHSLKYYHVLHHFEDSNTGFGISTKFWDYPFQTVNKKFQ